jgi:hypothetical protein
VHVPRPINITLDPSPQLQDLPPAPQVASHACSDRHVTSIPTETTPLAGVRNSHLSAYGSAATWIMPIGLIEKLQIVFSVRVDKGAGPGAPWETENEAPCREVGFDARDSVRLGECGGFGERKTQFAARSDREGAKGGR